MERLTYWQLSQQQKEEAVKRYDGNIAQAVKGYYLLVSGVIVAHCLEEVSK